YPVLMFDWLMDKPNTREELRSITMVHGVLYVMITGMIMQLQWCAECLDTALLEHQQYAALGLATTQHLVFSWTMLSVVDMKFQYTTVAISHGTLTIVRTMKMLVYVV
ncbi:hypothetical protein ACJMK2_001403, partial [Sinanodonta woodiana]